MCELKGMGFVLYCSRIYRLGWKWCFMRMESLFRWIVVPWRLVVGVGLKK